jgi:RNA polymerase sigma factor (sigma-70 family)
VSDESTRPLDEGALRALVPRVLAGLVRRGEDFDAAEDALQEALLEALRVWPGHPPQDPGAWLAAVATRRLVDARRSEAARQRREETTFAEPRPVPAATEGVDVPGDDTLFVLFCCCHPDLAPASQVALTLRAVGGLTTREIADAFFVPEATMAQRISRAKRTVRGRSLDRPGDLAVVLRVLYLVYTAGHADRVDLAGEAIRLTRQLTLATQEPEARGLLALMLLNHARRRARLDPEGRIVTLDRQDRGLWDTREIAEGVRVLQSALAMQTEQRRPGRYQVEAAIAALHDDAASAEETDWPQVLAWYDDLVALTEDPVRQDPAAVLGRAVAVGHVLGAAAGLRETDRLREVIGDRHRWLAVRGHLHELGGDPPAAAGAYAEAAPPGPERRRARPPRPPGRPRASGFPVDRHDDPAHAPRRRRRRATWRPPSRSSPSSGSSRTMGPRTGSATCAARRGSSSSWPSGPVRLSPPGGTRRAGRRASRPASRRPATGPRTRRARGWPRSAARTPGGRATCAARRPRGRCRTSGARHASRSTPWPARRRPRERR